ncbi:unnamed protein product [Oppiella nova]|uniref:Uncharacterized protein n=1 Tax=Oppiella nova TaxID=334625 RepID=A0A7R9QER9_9ACAR|nr:unnamed protein product [Oppiella nova]CAD7653952.1 unnamed protein product [Oppiella nova]CAG2164337.1 unnamed protein product [Oppiella nova]CAG2171139.1 unnamed protein product [Oppiella nova]
MSAKNDFTFGLRSKHSQHLQRFHTNRLLTQTIATYYHFIVTTNRSHAWDATNYDHYLPLSDRSQCMQSSVSESPPLLSSRDSKPP